MWKIYEFEELVKKFKTERDCLDYFEDMYCDDYGCAGHRWGARIVPPTYTKIASWAKATKH